MSHIPVEIRDRLNALRHKTALVRAANQGLSDIHDPDAMSGINACCFEIEDELRAIGADLEKAVVKSRALRVAS